MRIIVARLWRRADNRGMLVYGGFCAVALALGWCAGLFYVWHWCWERSGLFGLLLGRFPGAFAALFSGALLALLWPLGLIWVVLVFA